jgi:predicted transcriptional regulator
MPGRSTKYTAAQNAALEIETLDTLVNAERALTIEEIINSNMNLVGHSTQKMARVLSSLIERGTVLKGYSKEKGKNIYTINS